jgi:electron transfer flavoprotein alpha subunit
MASRRAATVVSREPVGTSGRPELADASVVVSGGRGVGSAEHFRLVEDLADALGAAVGASRAAVDAGYYPPSSRSGRPVRQWHPSCTSRWGSRAPSAPAGMQTSKTIVEVNKDPRPRSSR